MGNHVVSLLTPAGGGGGGLLPKVINLPADFPTVAEANNEIGRIYIAGADVTDNDPTKTNTSQSFLAGNEFVWNGTNYTELGSDALWLDDGTDYTTVNPRNIDLQTSGLKDSNVTIAVKLGSAIDTSFNTAKKDIIGSTNEVLGELSSHVSATNPHLGSAASGANSDITSLSGLTTPLSIAQGGTNSNASLLNDRVMISSGGEIVESSTVTVSELDLLNGKVSVSTGTSDNDKLVTQGYVDDAVSGEDLWDRSGATVYTKTAGDNILTAGGGIGNLDDFTNYKFNINISTGNVQSLEYNPLGAGSVSKATTYWQSFTMTETTTLSAFAFKAASAVGSGNLEIRAGSGTGGAILVPQFGVTFTGGTGFANIFTFPSRIPVTSGQQYTAIFYPVADPNINVLAGYAGGTNDLGSDYLFRVYKDVGMGSTIGTDAKHVHTFETSTASDVASKIETTINAEVDAVKGHQVIMNAYSGGFTGGEDVLNYNAVVNGNASDTNVFYSAFTASLNKNGGTSEGSAYVAGENWDNLILSLSGDIVFRDYAVTINPERFADGDGDNLTLSAGDGLGTDKSGGNLYLNAGTATGSGNDGKIFVGHELVFGDNTATDKVFAEYDNGATNNTILQWSSAVAGLTADAYGLHLYTSETNKFAGLHVESNSHQAVSVVSTRSTGLSIKPYTFLGQLSAGSLQTGTRRGWKHEYTTTTSEVLTLQHVSDASTSDQVVFNKQGENIAVNIAGGGLQARSNSSGMAFETYNANVDNNYPMTAITAIAHDNISQLYDAYYDGSNFKSSDAGSNFRWLKNSDLFKLQYATGFAQGANITSWSDAISVEASTGIIKTYQGQIVNTTTVNAATYDLTTSDYILNVTYTTTGAVTSLTIPTAQFVAGRIFHVKDAGGNAAANPITIDTQGSEKIDGQDTLVINSNYGSASLYIDGSNAFVI